MVVELANDANRSQGNSRGAACVPKRNDANSLVDIFHQRTSADGPEILFWAQNCESILIRSYYGLTN